MWSDVVGTCSRTVPWYTGSATRSAMAMPTFSPLSTGSQNNTAPTASNSSMGTSRLSSKYCGWRFHCSLWLGSNQTAVKINLTSNKTYHYKKPPILFSCTLYVSNPQTLKKNEFSFTFIPCTKIRLLLICHNDYIE